MRLKMKLKMSQKWPKNVYHEQPYTAVSCGCGGKIKICSGDHHIDHFFSLKLSLKLNG